MRLKYKYIVAILYAVVLFLDRLDLTIVNTTLPTVAHYFNVPINQTDWISIAFLLALAIAIPISHWLGERFGVKKIFIVAMLLFGISSTACAWANSLNSLFLLRFLQGLDGGILIPVGMILIYNTYEKSEYASITSFMFLPSLIAPAIAPFLGGLLLDQFGWRVVFIFSGPICILLTIVSILYLRNDKQRKVYPLDWLGFLLAAGILMGVFYSLSYLANHLFSLRSYLFIASLIPLIAIFIYWEKRVAIPLIDLSYFTNHTFIKANLLQLCFQTCHFGAIFLIGMYLQIGVGMSATMAGLIMGMQAFGAMATSRLSVTLFNRYGAKLPIIIGLLGVAVLSPCIMLITNANMIAFGLVLFFLRGIFSGLCGVPIQTLSVISFDKDNIAVVNSIFNACRQVAISFGVAISAMVLAIGLNRGGLIASESIPPQLLHTIFSPGFYLLPIIATIGIGIAWSLDKD